MFSIPLKWIDKENNSQPNKCWGIFLICSYFKCHRIDIGNWCTHPIARWSASVSETYASTQNNNNIKNKWKTCAHSDHHKNPHGCLLLIFISLVVLSSNRILRFGVSVFLHWTKEKNVWTEYTMWVCMAYNIVEPSFPFNSDCVPMHYINIIQE